MLALDRGGESLIVGIPHPIEFEFAIMSWTSVRS
jgi:hypothetical protein